jgi:hypothetical protein
MERRKFLTDKLPKHAIGAEIGVHRGFFSQCILNRAAPREFHLIDPWEFHPSPVYQDSLYGSRVDQQELDERYARVCTRFANEIRAGQVIVHRQRSVDALQRFPDDYFDWIYIDGNHLYEFVKQDLELSFRKVKPDGLITGDDYGGEGWWEGGVERAVDEFLENWPVRLVMVRGQQFIIQKFNYAEIMV